jgi:phosphonoacetate hydrolase
MLCFIKSLSGVALALSAAEAAESLELPLDREGDIVVVAVKNAVIGSKKEEHDLSNLGEHRLRSHGGLSEQDVPILMSIPLGIQLPEGKATWRNFDIFDLVLNSQT